MKVSFQTVYSLGMGLKSAVIHHFNLILMQLFQRRFYEKPTKKRERLEYEKCFRIYNREMKKKIAFLMKQHDPLPPI